MGRILVVNDTWLRCLGYEKEEVIGRWFGDFLHPDQKEAFRTQFPINIQKHEPIRGVEFCLMRKDGSSLLADYTASIGRDAQGQFVRTHCAFQDITDRKRTEEEAARANALNVTVIDSIPGSFYMLDENGYFVRWNTYQRDEIIGKPDELISSIHALDTIHPDDRELVQSRIMNVSENGVDELVEARVLLHGGPAFRWLLMTGKRLFIDNRPFLLGIGIDITARKQAEQKLETLHRQLDSVLFAVPDLLIAIDHDLNILYSNAKGHDLILQPDPAKHIKCFSRFKLLDSPCEDCSVLPVFATGQSVEREMTNPADGRVREVRAFPILARDGTVEAVVEYVRDVTERKQAEQALSESEERNRLLSDVTIEGILLHRNGVAIDMNAAMTTMMGYERDALLQQNFLQYIHEDDIQLVRDNIVKEVALPYTVRMQRKNGTFFYAEIESHNFQYQGESIRVSAVRDISERKTLEAQLMHAMKMESVGRLAGGVAHDFNNMLGVILGYAELALMNLEDTSPLREDLGEIKRAAERSADLTRQLLAFARKQVVDPRVVDLNETVAGMLKMLRRLIGEDILLAWHPAIGPCLLHIDPSQLDQILANLCVNARDAIDGIGTLTIETQQADIDAAYSAIHPEALAGAYVVLIVSDTGCGMSADTLNHIFEPFFSTKGVGEGTGLGLATVYGILKQNRGFISVYSEPGQGTTFKLYFPRYVDAMAQVTTATEAVLTLGGTETILIVEDETAILTLTNRILEQHGYTVLTARTPSEALNLVDKQHGAIQLVLTDVIMPEMTGRQLVERIQTRFADISVIYMSGYTANVIAPHGVLESGVHFLQKPFTLHDVLGKVRQVLDAASQ